MTDIVNKYESLGFSVVERPPLAAAASLLDHEDVEVWLLNLPDAKTFDYKKLDGLDAVEIDLHQTPAFGQAAGRLTFPASTSATVAASPSPGAQSQELSILWDCLPHQSLVAILPQPDGQHPIVKQISRSATCIPTSNLTHNVSNSATTPLQPRYPSSPHTPFLALPYPSLTSLPLLPSSEAADGSVSAKKKSAKKRKRQSGEGAELGSDALALVVVGAASSAHAAPALDTNGVAGGAPAAAAATTALSLYASPMAASPASASAGGGSVLGSEGKRKDKKKRKIGSVGDGLAATAVPEPTAAASGPAAAVEASGALIGQTGEGVHGGNSVWKGNLKAVVNVEQQAVAVESATGNSGKKKKKKAKEATGGIEAAATVVPVPGSISRVGAAITSTAVALVGGKKLGAVQQTTEAAGVKSQTAAAAVGHQIVANNAATTSTTVKKKKKTKKLSIEGSNEGLSPSPSTAPPAKAVSLPARGILSLHSSELLLHSPVPKLDLSQAYDESPPPVGEKRAKGANKGAFGSPVVASSPEGGLSGAGVSNVGMSGTDKGSDRVISGESEKKKRKKKAAENVAAAGGSTPPDKAGNASVGRVPAEITPLPERKNLKNDGGDKGTKKKKKKQAENLV